MMVVPLSGAKAAGRVARVDDSDYEQAMRYVWYVWERQRAGRWSGPYAITVIWVDGRRTTMKMHRLLMPGAGKVDHEDGDGLNCQRYNLRKATDSQNQANTGKRTGQQLYTSQFKGVSWRPKGNGAWLARCGDRYLGRYRGRGRGGPGVRHSGPCGVRRVRLAELPRVVLAGGCTDRLSAVHGPSS